MKLFTPPVLSRPIAWHASIFLRATFSMQREIARDSSGCIPWHSEQCRSEEDEGYLLSRFVSNVNQGQLGVKAFWLGSWDIATSKKEKDWVLVRELVDENPTVTLLLSALASQQEPLRLCTFNAIRTYLTVNHLVTRILESMALRTQDANCSGLRSGARYFEESGVAAWGLKAHRILVSPVPKSA